MSCILRIYGSTLDVDALRVPPSLKVDRYWRKGEAHRANSKRINTDSGIQIIVSNADITEVERQVEEVTKVLKENWAAIAVVTSAGGVESAVLSFGVALLEGNVAAFLELPRDLVALAAKAGLSIDMSTYLTCSDEETDA